MQRIFGTVLTILLSFTLLGGCAKRSEGRDAPSPAPAAPEVIVLDGANDDAGGMQTSGSDKAAHAGIYCVDATEDVSADGAYASLTENENAVLVQNAGVLHMTNADINKLGDATEALSSGQNAAVAATTGGQCFLDGCVVTSNATGGFGLYASGAQTLLQATDCVVATSSASSFGLCAFDGGSLSMRGGSISVEDGGSPLLLGGTDATIALQNVSLQGAGAETVRVLSGKLTLSLLDQALTGGVSIQDGAALWLMLSGTSVFTGAFDDALPAKANISLDETSQWNLTADCTVGAFVNADATHKNILSNGYSIYYDSNLAENAPLEAQSFRLEGGGYLAPII